MEELLLLVPGSSPYHFVPARLRRALIPTIFCLSLFSPVLARAQGTPEAATPTLSGKDAALYAPVLPDERDEIYAETAGDLSLYKIKATLTPASLGIAATIEGDLNLTFVNNT